MTYLLVELLLAIDDSGPRNLFIKPSLFELFPSCEVKGKVELRDLIELYFKFVARPTEFLQISVSSNRAIFKLLLLIFASARL